ncbi:MAG: hypothetical protein WCL00_13900, partial [Bacteroidota bacterium]
RDSVGYYNTVVGFAVNQSNQIIYIIQRTVVYDSVSHIADDRARNRYTYLQVPLIAGFRLYETSRIGLTIETGPMVSFLVGTRVAQPVINLPNARIIRIDNNTPDRSKINLQAYLGLRFDYQFTKGLGLYVQPYYKYYFKPIIEQKEQSVANPYSFGMGIGILYNFGRKH